MSRGPRSKAEHYDRAQCEMTSCFTPHVSDGGLRFDNLLYCLRAISPSYRYALIGLEIELGMTRSLEKCGPITVSRWSHSHQSLAVQCIYSAYFCLSHSTSSTPHIGQLWVSYGTFQTMEISHEQNITNSNNSCILSVIGWLIRGKVT